VGLRLLRLLELFKLKSRVEQGLQGMISKGGNEQEHLGKIKSDVPMMLPILDLTTIIEVMVVVTRLELRKRALVAAAAAVAEAGPGRAGRETSPSVLGQA
jgi:hypothetical protein